MTEVRASDADRAAVTARLSTALSDGRLDVFEYEERLRRALTATTTNQLEPITADLPVRPEELAAEKRQREEREYVAEWGYWLGGAVIMTSIWGITSLAQSELQFYWPVMPLGVWALILLALLFWDDMS
jgi:type VI protein secretion system component VasF